MQNKISLVGCVSSWVWKHTYTYMHVMIFSFVIHCHILPSSILPCFNHEHLAVNCLDNNKRNYKQSIWAENIGTLFVSREERESVSLVFCAVWCLFFKVSCSCLPCSYTSLIIAKCFLIFSDSEFTRKKTAETDIVDPDVSTSLAGQRLTADRINKRNPKGMRL